MSSAPATLVVMVAACMAVLLMNGAAALHFCGDRLYNGTQDKHEDGLPHLTPTEEATWMSLLPRKLGPRAAFDWMALYRSITRGGAGGADPPETLAEASLHDVRLEPGSIYWQGQQTNLQYLLYLDPDRLAWTFRRQASLPVVGEPYGGWEAPDSQLRGHFIGHYLSASARMWASTHNATMWKKMTRLVDILHGCQKNVGTGYLAAYPDTMFDSYEQLFEAWSPYYTIHKIMQGLLDQYTFAGNKKGLDMVVWMADYFSDRMIRLIQKYSLQRHWEAMNEETGGFNDVMYQLHDITKDPKHWVMARLFDKPCFLGPLSLHVDDISGLHANTHIPIIVGIQKGYEVTGEQQYKDIVTSFVDILNSSHTFATGGTSTAEHWHDPKRMVNEIKINTNQESCSTFNLLKIMRTIFSWNKEVEFADYYERLLINGIMGNQRGTEPGVMLYFLPMGPGRSKSVSGLPPSGLPPNNPGGWGNPNATFWCCYGTGIESFSKLGDSIYFMEKKSEIPSVHIIQYIPSTFDWKAAGLTIKQQSRALSSTDSHFEVSLSISAKGDARPANVSVRIPSWTSADGATATLNGEKLNLTSAGGFLSVNKHWHDDTLLLRFPIGLRTEAIKDDRPEYGSIKAVLFGPHLLAGLTHGGKVVADSNHSNDGLTLGTWGVNATGAAPIADWVTPLDHSSLDPQLVSLTQPRAAGKGEAGALVLSVSVADGALAMQKVPAAGSDACVHATFRVYPAAGGGATGVGRSLRGRDVTIEPFDRPGMAVTNGLAVGKPGPDALFNAVAGLDGLPGTVSLELKTRPGCFVAAPGEAAGKVHVGCLPADGNGDDAALRRAASFTPAAPLRRYNPLSFAARGTERNFFLEPLHRLQDEFYTVYFNLVGDS